MLVNVSWWKASFSRNQFFAIAVFFWKFTNVQDCSSNKKRGNQKWCCCTNYCLGICTVPHCQLSIRTSPLFIFIPMFVQWEREVQANARFLSMPALIGRDSRTAKDMYRALALPWIVLADLRTKKHTYKNVFGCFYCSDQKCVKETYVGKIC